MQVKRAGDERISQRMDAHRALGARSLGNTVTVPNSTLMPHTFLEGQALLPGEAVVHRHPHLRRPPTTTNQSIKQSPVLSSRHVVRTCVCGSRAR
eukprot:174650-Pyramimonas_sp.AAC.2